MSGGAPRDEAEKWLREADRDLHAAKLLLTAGEPEAARSLFHSQQAAELAIKEKKRDSHYHRRFWIREGE